MVANLSFYSILLWTVVLKSKTMYQSNQINPQPLDGGQPDRSEDIGPPALHHRPETTGECFACLTCFIFVVEIFLYLLLRSFCILFVVEIFCVFVVKIFRVFVVEIFCDFVSAHLLSTTVQKQPASALHVQHIREFSPVVGGASLIVNQNCSTL